MAALFQPKPWLDLFCTNFPLLRQARASQLQILYPDSRKSNDVPETDTSEQQECPNDQTKFDVRSLPPDVLSAIFARLEAEQLSTLAQVCKKFLSHAYEPAHWRRIAHRTWPCESTRTLEKRLYNYKTWRKLCIHRPRLRTNAIYVARHQFAKTAVRSATSEPVAPVFLVTYHRFLRFYSDGTVVSLTTPEPPDLSYRRVRRAWMPSVADRDKAHPSIGRYELDEGKEEVSLSLPMAQPKFPAMRTGTMYMRFSLSHTTPGACDRLFLTEHYAIMDNDGGELISYSQENFGGKPFRLVPIWGFRNKVYKEFPRDDDRDLAQWYEMKKAARAARRRNGTA